jgi:hypothetical protein
MPVAHQIFGAQLLLSLAHQKKKGWPTSMPLPVAHQKRPCATGKWGQGGWGAPT